MDYHVVAYTNYELVGLPLPKLWASFSILQVESWSCKLSKEELCETSPVALTHSSCDIFAPRWFNITLAAGIAATSTLCLGWDQFLLHSCTNIEEKCWGQTHSPYLQKSQMLRRNVVQIHLKVRHLANWLGDRVLKTLLETYRSRFQSVILISSFSGQNLIKWFQNWCSWAVLNGMLKHQLQLLFQFKYPKYGIQ